MHAFSLSLHLLADYMYMCLCTKHLVHQFVSVVIVVMSFHIIIGDFSLKPCLSWR